MMHILVLGTGPKSEKHLQAYMKMKQVQIVGIVDERSGHSGREQGIPQFDSFEEAIEKLSVIDVVDLCLPIHLHKRFIEKAAALGKSIICAEPVARNRTEIQDIIDVCASNDVQLFASQRTRFTPAYEHAKQAVDSGAIGQAGVVRVTRNALFPSDRERDDLTTDDMIIDSLTPDFDFLRWCFGEVKRVYAKSFHKTNTGPIIYTLVTLRFASGMIAHVEGSWSDQTPATSFELAGDSGMITFDSQHEQSIELMTYGQSNSAFLSPTVESPWEKELTYFIDCIRNNPQPIESVTDTCKALNISLAALKSIHSNESITIPNNETGGAVS